jgi:hypothetical protein
MKNLMTLLLLIFGLTFIYNPVTGVGFVYVNDADFNAVIIADPTTNTMHYFKGVPYFQERMDTGMQKWLADKQLKGFPFKSNITPYQLYQDQQKRMQIR